MQDPQELQEQSFLIPDFSFDNESDKENAASTTDILKTRLSGWNHSIYLNRDTTASTAATYGIKNLKEIFAISKKDMEEESHLRVRFVLLAKDPMDKTSLVFGQEGRANHRSIPAHRDLANGKPVYAAGTLYFNEQGQIIGVDNKSGDFRTPLVSLFPLLYLLGQNKNLLHDSLTITSTVTQESFTIPVSSIENLKLPEKPAAKGLEEPSKSPCTPRKGQDAKRRSRQDLSPYAQRGLTTFSLSAPTTPMHALPIRIDSTPSPAIRYSSR